MYPLSRPFLPELSQRRHFLFFSFLLLPSLSWSLPPPAEGGRVGVLAKAYRDRDLS
jgi:hypothetical protein